MVRWVIWWSDCFWDFWKKKIRKKKKRYRSWMSLIYQMLICQDSINQLQDSEMFRVRTKEMSSRNVINFSFYSFLSSKEIAIQKQTSCKYRIFKSSENSFVQTIRHWTDCKETICIRWQYSEGNWWVETVIYGSMSPFPFLQKSGSFLERSVFADRI